MNRLYTYGYSKGSIDDLIGYAAAGAVIVDVRYRAASRNPVWAKSRLGGALTPQYCHLPSLGNVNYRSGGPIVLADADGGLEKLGALLERAPVVILCACSDVRTCHRLTVANEAQARWPLLQVTHLKPGERLVEGAPTLF